MKCRHCAAPVTLDLVDLGTAPPSNAYLSAEKLHAPESWYPLRVRVCERCWLVQTEDFARAEELFTANYAYFSGFSAAWHAHCRQLVAAMTERFGLGSHSYVIEVAANDGTLLDYVQERGIPCTGIEPTASTAAAARAKGHTVIQAFFGRALAEELVAESQAADWIAANNVLAHVPDINDFVAGFTVLLKPQGVATFEFPHLLRLIEETQFDTMYHEHFSYLSLGTVSQIFAHAGLTVFDVEELPTHGGSLRVFAQHAESGRHPRSPRVAALLDREAAAGLFCADTYARFQARVDALKNEFLAYLLDAKRSSKRLAAYGAAAKGNTLLNYAGVRRDLLAFVVDRNPAKQGKFLPGSRIPIVGEEHLKAEKPDIIVILPWNLRDEITAQLDYARTWGARFVTAVPRLEVWP
ncbi:MULTISPECIES: class I SAM-dependent methyltransferase [unclassified Thermosynechococcus]|uniref:class I SAM-dependent methyltransferase n=1 Tax=unclassified Thermosynechococcus TaxID=2622553 RepID=UPI0028F422A9|nr:MULTISPECIES: class I SAM-dependent methyltransferase [unclassified Thermosynechococcus]